MCGSVRFEASGEPQDVILCHCKSCRQHTGAPIACLAVFPADQVVFMGNTAKIFESSPSVRRGFCGVCGSSLTWEMEMILRGSICAIHISAFDMPETLKPNSHSFYTERLLWFDVADTLPRYESFVAGGKVLQYGPGLKDPDTA